jgi:SSS family solute:Na+ symporter
MKVIGYTDVLQVIFLVIGGLVTTYLAINLVSNGSGIQGVMSGLGAMRTEGADHFHMILQKGQMMYTDGTERKDAYMELPGLAVLIGGMWIVNLNYWGCNQYITQRALGADLPTARKGILFAAFLKLLMPVIVVLPGIACYVLHQRGMFQAEMLNEKGVLTFDKAYPVLLNLLPAGLKGLSFAALTAAIVASLAGKANSIATIFTLDIYKNYINKDASEKQLVWIGRISVIVAVLLGSSIILTDYFAGIMKQGGFGFIQEMTGLLSPGIFASFVMGFFWKRTNSAGALFAIVGGFLISLYSHFNLSHIPFIDRMGWVFVCCVTVMVALGYLLPDERKGLEIDTNMFKVDRIFAIGASIILATLAVLYYTFW